MGGGNGASATPLNGPVNIGAAPGGGGSGAARNGNGTTLGGSGGAGSVTLTYAIETGVTKYAVTSVNSSEIAGAPFDVTITAQDNSDTTVPDNINTVVMTSPTVGSFMEFDWDRDGTFGDNSGTLVNGVKTIRARNKKAQLATIVATTGALTTPAPLDMITVPGVFATLQILAPGETAAPGTTTGKTGAPTNQTVGTAFNVIVNSVDPFWNPVSTVTDTVSITSTDGLASRPSDTALIAGTRVLPVTFGTPSAQTLTTSDVSDGNKSPDTTPNITVIAIAKTWVGGIDGNKWDTATQNWNGLSTFSDHQAVTFSDTGSVTPAVDIVGTVSPFSVTVNNSASFPYEFSNGTISGTAGGLIKQGTGTLTLSNANSYTGSTRVSGNGLLLLQNASALPASSALTLDSGVIGLGAGNFTRVLGTGAGQVNIIASNSGFAAYGAHRVVNLGGAFASLTFGTGSFFPATGSPALVLGSTTATHTVEFQNPVVLSGIRFFTAVDGPAAVEARLSGAITGSTSFSKAGTGTLELTNTGNAWTTITFIDSGTLKLGASQVIPNGSNVVVKRGNTTGNTSGVLDISGFNETIGALTLGESGTTAHNSGQTPSVINSGGAAMLTLGGSITYEAGTVGILNGQATISANIATGTAGNRDINVGDGSAADDLVISGGVSGGSVTKLGIGTLVLSGSNTYSGATNVNAGTLTLGAANPNNNASTITVAASAVLNLAYSGTDTVTSLVIAGVSQPVGVYGATEFPGVLTGAGTITVAPADPYSSWSDGASFTGDANNDGVQNGIAWLLGAQTPNVNANGLLPLVTETSGALTMTFSMRNAASRGAAVLEVQHSSDLGITDSWTGVVVPNTSITDISGVSFVIIPGTPPSDLNSVQATIPMSAAAGGKVFGRLKGIQ